MSMQTVSAEVSDQLRDRLALLAASVSIVSAHGADGPAAITITSVTSVSLEPPALLVCVNKQSRLLAAIEDSGAFRVNYLASDQANLARAFGRPKDGNIFSDPVWSLKAQSGPGVTGAVAQIACRRVSRSDYGSHAVLIGAVEAISGEAGDPLVYVQREYGRAMSASDAAGHQD